LPCIEAKHPNGRKVKGFAAFTPKDLDRKLSQGIDDAFDEGFFVFLVVPHEMTDSAEDCLRVWGSSKKISLKEVK
jgi:hypothetical protein